MALIGKIRNNMWLVIVLLAVALGGFILMDMTSASNRGSFGSRTTIGEVAGQKLITSISKRQNLHFMVVLVINIQKRALYGIIMLKMP